MFNPFRYDNARPDGHSLLEVLGGYRDSDDPVLCVPLKRTELHGTVTGPLADLQLVQTFAYTREQCALTLEALYRFPLPGDAAVQQVTVCFGEVELHTELKARDSAEAEYRAARAEGRQAVLSTQEAPNVFTLHVTGLMPDQDIVVTTHYVQLARPDGIGWRLRTPLTTAPRYVRADESLTRAAAAQPLGLLRDPGHRFAVNLTLESAAAVSSPTHALDIASASGKATVRLQAGEVVPDRDFVLNWQPEQLQKQASLSVLTHQDVGSGYVYFLAQITPPVQPDPATAVSREVTLLVDHSGSMEGAKWAAADWAVEQFLSGLTEHDYLSLGVFHHETRWLEDGPIPATPEALSRAVAFLKDNKDGGGTDLAQALWEALEQDPVEGECVRHLLILTEGQVTDEYELFDMADRETEREDRRRISILCIDAAPNDFLASELARRGGGYVRFLTSDPEEEDITMALDTILEQWAQPLHTGLRLEVNVPAVESSGRPLAAARQTGWSAVEVADLPGGRSVWVIGRAVCGQTRDLEFRVTNVQGRPAASYRVALDDRPSRPGLKTLFGAQRLRDLEHVWNQVYERFCRMSRERLIPALIAFLDRDIRYLEQIAGSDQSPMITLEEWERELRLALLKVVRSYERGLKTLSEAQNALQWKVGWCERDHGLRRGRIGQYRLLVEHDALLDWKSSALKAWVDLNETSLPELQSLRATRHKRYLEMEAVRMRETEITTLADNLNNIGYPGLAGKFRLPDKGATAKPLLQHKDAISLLSGLLVSESLHFGLIGAETAFIGQREEKGALVNTAVPVENALPTSWSDTFTPPMIHPVFHCGGASDIGPKGQVLPYSLRQFTGGDSISASKVSESSEAVVFAGMPIFVNGECTLFDSVRTEDEARLSPDGIATDATFKSLQIVAPEIYALPIDSGLCLLLYIDDPALPRVTVRLADLKRHGGIRPLNLSRTAGQRVRIVLVDPNGVWKEAAPAIEVRLT